METDLRELGKGTVWAEAQHLAGQFVQQATEQQAHEGRELAFGKLIVERFVLHVLRAQRIERALHIGNRLGPTGGEDLHHAQRETMRRHDTLAATEPGEFAEFIELRFAEGTFELVNHRTCIDVCHSITPRHDATIALTRSDRCGSQKFIYQRVIRSSL